MRFWKPEGYPNVSPYLVVENAQRVVDFLQKTFDAKILRRYNRSDGSIMHVELQFEDSVVMIGDATESWTAIASQLHIYVKDVVKSYRNAIDAGGVSVMEPSRKDGDPDRRCGVKDPSGNIWWIATQEEDQS